MEQHTRFEHQTPFLKFVAVMLPGNFPDAPWHDRARDTFPFYCRADHVASIYPPWVKNERAYMTTHTVIHVSGQGPYIVEGDADDILMRVLQAGGNKTVGSVRFSPSHDDGEF